MAGKTFTKAPETIMSRIRQIAEDYHDSDMHIPGGEDKKSNPIDVSVEAFLVYGPRDKNGEQTGPAIMVRGCEAFACIRSSKLEERVAGRSDVIIHVDGDKYKTWSVETLNAILDHELEHVELQRDAESVPILDDVGRPKIKMRPHDHDFGWFDSVAKRHGYHAIEVVQAAVFATTELKQLYFPELVELPPATKEITKKQSKLAAVGSR